MLLRVEPLWRKGVLKLEPRIKAWKRMWMIEEVAIVLLLLPGGIAVERGKEGVSRCRKGRA